MILAQWATNERLSKGGDDLQQVDARGWPHRTQGLPELRTAQQQAQQWAGTLALAPIVEYSAGSGNPVSNGHPLVIEEQEKKAP